MRRFGQVPVDVTDVNDAGTAAAPAPQAQDLWYLNGKLPPSRLNDNHCLRRCGRCTV